MRGITYKFYFLYLLFFFLIFSFPGLVFGAKTPSSDSHYSVEIIPFSPEEKEKYQLKIIQPYSFDLTTIQKAMASLAYQEKIISWSRRKRVFSDSVIRPLSSLIVEKFSEADENHRLVFTIKKPSGRIVLQGDTFLTPKGMHWRFTVLNSTKRKIDDFSIMGDSWRLVPLKGQMYKTKQPYNNLVQDITGWIVFVKFRPEASRVVKVPPPIKKEDPENKGTPSEVALEITKRLEILEILKKEGLINKAEYRMKRLEILKSF